MNKILDKKIFRDYKRQFGRQKYVCNAPFTSLYFKPDGSIKPCCALIPEFSFGQYPEINIKEALLSENRIDLQNRLSKLDFSGSCVSCYENMISGNFMSAINSQYRLYKPKEWPEVIEFELSYYCNLDCIMCNLHTNKINDNIYDHSFIDKIIPYVKRAKAVKFLGGEPFVIPVYKELWKAILKYSLSTEVHIQTNGTIFNNDIIEIIKNLNVYIGISIDSLNEHIYSKIRRGAKLSKVLENVEKFNSLLNNQGRELSFSFTPMNLNLNEIPQFVNYVNSYSGLLYFNSLTMPYSLGIKQMTSDELLKSYQLITQTKYEHKQSKYYNQNKITLDNFIKGVDLLIKDKKTCEKAYKPLRLESWLPDFKNRIVENDAIAFLEKILTPQYLDNIILPHIQDKISKLNDEQLNYHLNKWVMINDVDNVLHFLELDKKEINADS